MYNVFLSQFFLIPAASYQTGRKITMIYRVDHYRNNAAAGGPDRNERHCSPPLVLCICDKSHKDSVIVGSGPCNSYVIQIEKSVNSSWRMAVGDFIDYCNLNRLDAVLEITQTDYEDALSEYGTHHCNDKKLRGYEPPVLIHSTTMDNWLHIQRDGVLKSWNRLKKERTCYEKTPIGAILGDPESFRDYVMFGTGMHTELVVSSKLAGRIAADVHAPYQTGARLYFNAEKIAEHGLLIRDGCHLKVKDSLPLSPYLIWAATWDKIGLNSPLSTPEIFAGTADRMFDLIRPYSRGTHQQNT